MGDSNNVKVFKLLSFAIHTFVNGLRNRDLLWLRNKVRIIFPADPEGFVKNIWNGDQFVNYISFVAYKTISSIVAPNDNMSRFTHTDGKTFFTSFELLSPIVHVETTAKYFFTKGESVRIEFNFTREDAGPLNTDSSSEMDLSSQNSTYFTCGALDASKPSTTASSGGLLWKINACSMVKIHANFSECECSQLGLYGLLRVSTKEVGQAGATSFVSNVDCYDPMVLLATIGLAYLFLFG